MFDRIWRKRGRSESILQELERYMISQWPMKKPACPSAKYVKNDKWLTIHRSCFCNHPSGLDMWDVMWNFGEPGKSKQRVWPQTADSPRMMNFLIIVCLKYKERSDGARRIVRWVFIQICVSVDTHRGSSTSVSVKHQTRLWHGPNCSHHRHWSLAHRVGCQSSDSW